MDSKTIKNEFKEFIGKIYYEVATEKLKEDVEKKKNFTFTAQEIYDIYLKIVDSDEDLDYGMKTILATMVDMILELKSIETKGEENNETI